MHLDVRPIADIDVLQRCLKDINDWRGRVCVSLWIENTVRGDHPTNLFSFSVCVALQAKQTVKDVYQMILTQRQTHAMLPQPSAPESVGEFKYGADQDQAQDFLLAVDQLVRVSAPCVCFVVTFGC